MRKQSKNRVLYQRDIVLSSPWGPMGGSEVRQQLQLALNEGRQSTLDFSPHSFPPLTSSLLKWRADKPPAVVLFYLFLRRPSALEENSKLC